MTLLLLILASVASLAAAAFCAATETAFLSVSRERILHLAREGGRKAMIVQRALSDMSRTTVVMLIGNNLASVAYSTATAAIIAESSSDSVLRSLWSFVAAFIVLYFSEFLPKLLCSARPLRRSLVLARPYSAVEFALRPLTSLAIFFTNAFMREGTEKRPVLTSEDILRILEDRKDGVCLSDIESALIGRIMALRMKNRPITAESILSAVRD